MRGILIRWLVTSFALWLTATLLPGLITVRDNWTILLAGLILGLINALVRPVVILLTLPFTLLSLGLFLFVVNALMLSLAAFLSGDSLNVNGFWGAVLGSLAVSLISLLLTALIGERGKINRLRSGYEQ